MYLLRKVLKLSNSKDGSGVSASEMRRGATNGMANPLEDSTLFSIHSYQRRRKRPCLGSHSETTSHWNAQSGTQIGGPLHGPESGVLCVAVNSDGKCLVPATRQYGAGTAKAGQKLVIYFVDMKMVCVALH